VAGGQNAAMVLGTAPALNRSGRRHVEGGEANPTGLPDRLKNLLFAKPWRARRDVNTRTRPPPKWWFIATSAPTQALLSARDQGRRNALRGRAERGREHR